MTDQIAATMKLQRGSVRIFCDEFEQNSCGDGLEAVLWPLLIVRKIGKNVNCLHIYASLAQSFNGFVGESLISFISVKADRVEQRNKGDLDLLEQCVNSPPLEIFARLLQGRKVLDHVGDDVRAETLVALRSASDEDLLFCLSELEICHGDDVNYAALSAAVQLMFDAEVLVG